MYTNISSSPSSSLSNDCLIVESHPRILFELDVPYRVVQRQQNPDCVILLRACSKDFELQAPPVLAIKDNVTKFSPPIHKIQGSSYLKILDIGDEIYVTQFQAFSNLAIPRSIERIIDDGENGCILLRHHGIALLAKRKSTLPKFSELGFITKVLNKGLQVYMTDTKTLGEKLIPPKFLINIPKELLKPGTRLRFDFILLPRGTHISIQEDLAIVPPALATFTPLHTTRVFKDYYLPTKLSIAGDVTCDDFSQYLLSSAAFFECLYRNDMAEALTSSLIWNLKNPKHAQIIYKSFAIQTGERSKNVGKSIFRPGMVAILKRIDPRTSLESSPVYIRISCASYKENETMIGFTVDANYLVQTWNLESLNDLRITTYKIERTDMLCHLRAFNAKLTDKDYIFSRLKDCSSKKIILSAFLPINESGENNNIHIRQIPPPIIEAEFDADMEFCSLTCAQKTAIKAILNGEEIVYINGGCKMGKTETMVYAIPGILQELIEPKCYDKCLALVSSYSTLPLLIKKLEKNKRYLELLIDGNIRLLNLVNLNSATVNGSFASTVKMLLNDSRYALSGEEKETLNKAHWSFQAKLCPQYHGNVDGLEFYDGIEMAESFNFYPDLPQANENDSDNESGENSASTNDYEELDLGNVTDDLITSTELTTLQSAINIIFKHYRPNYIIAYNDTFISLLPSLGDYVTHLCVDEADQSTAYDIIAMITESRNIEQLVVIGDILKYPDHKGIRIQEIPKCFDSAMKMMQASFTFIELNKTFNLNPGLAATIKELFYPHRNIESLLQRMPLESEHFKTPNRPLMFIDMDGRDLRVYPTTRYNPNHTYAAINAIQRVLETDNHLQVTILCYYEGQRTHILRALRKEKLDKIVEVSSVDAFYGKTTDVAIIVTTRNLDERKHPRRYVPIFQNDKLLLQRIPVPMAEAEELGNDAQHYSFIFDEQRLLTSLSRGEKATFIIGSAELLRENVKWNKILEFALTTENYVKEPPQPAESLVIGKKRKIIHPPPMKILDPEIQLQPRPKRPKINGPREQQIIVDGIVPLPHRQKAHHNRRELSSTTFHSTRAFPNH